jgi:hypothetical protein
MRRVFVFIILGCLLFSVDASAQSRLNVVIERNGCVESNISDFEIVFPSPDSTHIYDTLKVAYRIGEVIGDESMYESIMLMPPDSTALISFKSWRLVNGFIRDKPYSFKAKIDIFQQAYLHIKIFDLPSKIRAEYKTDFLWEYATDYFSSSNVTKRVKKAAQCECQ